MKVSKTLRFLGTLTLFPHSVPHAGECSLVENASASTVLVIEHNLHVIKNADWIIDMGPEGGRKGGTIMFEGTPQELLNPKKSLTGAYLRNWPYLSSSIPFIWCGLLFD